MPADNPNLIPPPSIGESRSSLAAGTIGKPRSSKLWIIVLACIVAGIGLGVFVYQQSIAPTPTPTPKPAVTPKPVIPSPVTVIPSPSPVVPEVNVVTPQSNNIVVPKAGELRLYFAGYDPTHPSAANQVIKLISNTGESELTMPATIPAADKMVVKDTNLTVTAGQTVKIEMYDGGDEDKPSGGWILPNSAGKCGTNGDADPAPLIAWATTKAGSEPLFSKQCWGDWGPASDTDYNDMFIILSYKPASAAGSPAASPSSAANASPKASPSSSPKASASASPKSSKSPSPSPKGSVVASPRVTMPEGSALPEAGIFEVTAGTMGMGLIFVLLGILGLLLI